MKLLTKEIETKLPKLYSQEHKEPKDVKVIVKFFDPTGSWTWYATEGEQQENGDWLFFGLVDGFEKELGYFTLEQLLTAKKGARGFQSLPIERDRFFNTETTLEEIMNK